MADTHAHSVRFVRESMLPEQEPPPLSAVSSNGCA